MSVASALAHNLGLCLPIAASAPEMVGLPFALFLVSTLLLALIAVGIMYRRMVRMERDDQIGRNAALISALGEIVYERDMDADRIDWHGAVESTLGLKASEAGTTSRFWMEAIHPDDRARVVAHFAAVVEDQTRFNIEYRFRHRDGHYVWIGDRGVSRRSPGSNHRSLIGVMEDIGYRKHYEEIITQSAEQLQRSNKELQQFAYVASHDLQEPLRKIIAFGDLLKSRAHGDLPADVLVCVDRMQNSAAQMRTFIEDLLDYTRVQTKKRPPETVGLNATTDAVLASLELQIAEAGAILDIDDLAPVRGDPSQIRQLIQNLISNALKYRIRGRTLVVNMRTRELDNGMVELTVTDNGIGFDPRFAERIFAPFQRLHSRSEYEGTGMGLAICRRIAESHGGTISAASQDGEGARFVVTLPAG